MTTQKPVLWLFCLLCSGHKRLTLLLIPLLTDREDFLNIKSAESAEIMLGQRPEQQGN